MGRKVHPTGFRIGYIKDWQAKWYSGRSYVQCLQEDLKLREAIRSKYSGAAVSLVETDRQEDMIVVTINTARPGVVIGRGGQRVDEMKKHLESLVGSRIQLNIQEIRQPELDASLVAMTVAEQIGRRVAYRRAMKQAIFRTIQAGAQGIRISCSGRLAGVEIARREVMHQGQVPLHKLRADIDYGFTEARTTLGRIGVKVWIYKGDILPEAKAEEAEKELPAAETAEAVVPAGTSPEVTGEGKAEGVEEVSVEETATVESKKEAFEAEESSREKVIEEEVVSESAPVEGALEPSVSDEKVKEDSGTEEIPVDKGEQPSDRAVKETAEAESKSAKPKARKKKTEGEEKAVKETAEAESEPAKPKARKKKTEGEETAVKETAEAESEPAKPKARKKKTEGEETAVKETAEAEEKSSKLENREDTGEDSSSSREIEDNNATT